MATALQVKNQFIFDTNDGYRFVVSKFKQVNDTSNTLTVPSGAVAGICFAAPGDTAASGTVTFSGTTATVGSSSAGSFNDQWLVTLHAGNVASIR